MKMNLSKYKKDVPGKYKIYFNLEKKEVEYEVAVVERITNKNTISSRLNPVVANSFKRTNNILKFEAENTSSYVGFDFREKLIYEDNNGDFSVYYNWKVNENVVCEAWYFGSETDGKMTIKSYVGEVVYIEEFSGYDLEDYSDYILNDIADDVFLEVNPIINVNDILALEDTVFEGELTLNNETYKLIQSSTYDSIEYSNNMFTEYNGINLTFGNQIIVPKTKTINQMTKPFVNKSYKRSEGILTYKAFAEYYLDTNNNYKYDNGDNYIQENLLYINDNNMTKIYTQWIFNDITIIEFWYNEIDGIGTTIVKTIDGVDEYDYINSVEIYSSYLVALGESLIGKPIEIYPMLIEDLENMELSGRLTNYGDNDYNLIVYKDAAKDYFTLFIEDNAITMINGFNIEFGADVLSDMPNIPQA